MENKEHGKRAGRARKQQKQKIDFPALSRSLGKSVTITLSDGTYQGELIHVDHGRAVMLSKEAPALAAAKNRIGRDSGGSSKQRLAQENLIARPNMIARLPMAFARQTRSPVPRTKLSPSAFNVKNLASGERKPGVRLFNASDILHVAVPVETQANKKKQGGKAREQASADRERGQKADENPVESSLEELLAAMEWRDFGLSSPYSEIIEAFKPDIEGKEAIHTSLQIIERAVGKLDIFFTVIDQLQVQFNLALSHIQCQADIGVSAAGSNLCRLGNLRWLQVASKSHVYMFDITALGPNVFKRGLKAVLEDVKIVKVIHDCRGLSDCLYHQYGVAICNVFDTQVADIFLYHMETGGLLPQRPSTLEECLKKHLNKPPSQISFLSHSQGIMKDISLVLSLYPMPLPLQKAVAVEASYVLSLRTSMINAMMVDFSALVNAYIKVYTQSNENVPNWTQLSNSWLPEDFQMLNNLQAKRRQMVPKKNVVGERGLLLLPGYQQDICGGMERKVNVVPTFPHPPQLDEKYAHPVSVRDTSATCTKKVQFNTDPFVGQVQGFQSAPVWEVPPSPSGVAAQNCLLHLAVPQVPMREGSGVPSAPLDVPRVQMSATQFLTDISITSFYNSHNV